MVETFIALFAAHVVADYVLQTKDIANNKHEIGPLALHGSVVLYTALLFTGSAAWPVLIAVAIHILTDLIKANAPKTLWSYLLDQGVHVATLLAVAYWFPSIWADGLWGDAPSWVPHFMGTFTGLIYATRAGGFAVAALMKDYSLTPKDTGDTGLQNAGTAIGNLERGLIFLLMMSGLAAGIGFLVAAKSILRFETIKSQDPATLRNHSEYVIIGTLASFIWAIAVSVVMLILLEQLPHLGIKLPNL